MYKYQALNVDFVYDAYFHVPIFDILKHQTDVIKCVYTALGERWYLPLNNIQVSGGSSMSDIKIKVILFNGSGVIEISPEKINATFKGIVRTKTNNDIPIIKDVIRMSLGSVLEIFPDAEIKTENFNVNADLIIQDEFDAVKHLAKFDTFASDVSLESVGADEVRNSIRLEFINSEMGWRSSFALSHSLNQNADLYCNILSMFDYPSTVKMSIDSKISLIDNIADVVLRKLDISENI